MSKSTATREQRFVVVVGISYVDCYVRDEVMYNNDELSEVVLAYCTRDLAGLYYFPL